MREHAETLEDFVLEERVRQAAYHYLADVYRYPEEFCRHTEVLDNLCEVAKAVDKTHLLPVAKRVRAAARDELQDSLNKEFAALFIGPQNLLAPPYGSVYLEPEKRQVMGKSTQDVQRLYRQAGLEVSKAFKQPPDHIRIELRFMSHLIARILEALEQGDIQQAEALVNTQLGFLQRHLARWVKPFSRLVIEHSTTELYTALGELTERFVAHDYQYGAITMYEDFVRLSSSSQTG